MSDQNPMASSGQSLPQPPPPGGFGGQPPYQPPFQSTPIGQPVGQPPVGYGPRNTITETAVPQAGVLGPSVSRGILCGLGAALVGGAVWYLIVTVTDSQIYYLAIILGLFIGYAVSWGTGKGGPVTALISAAIGAIAVVAAYYYIDRHFMIEGLESAGYIAEIPLIPSYQDLKDVLRLGFEAEGSQYAFCALCIGAAGFFGFKGVQQSQRFGSR
jgi:hypothetical protein